MRECGSRSDIASDQDYRSQPGSPGGSCRGSSVSATDQSTKAEVSLPHRMTKLKEDPFGGAKPREVVLNER